MAPEDRAVGLLDSATHLLMLARTLAQAQRALDLEGLDTLVGRACAACLDLPPEQGRALRPRLAALLAELDALAAAIAAGRGR
jgi:hypothetical protein